MLSIYCVFHFLISVHFPVKQKILNSFINIFHGIPVLWEQYILKRSMHLKFVSMWPIYFNFSLSVEKKK